MLTPFFVWHDKTLIKIHPESVLLLETEGNYTTFYLYGGTSYMVRTSLKVALKKLPRGIFIQTHPAYATSIYYVDKILNDHLEIDEKSVPISREFRDSVFRRLNIIGGVEESRRKKKARYAK